MALVNKPFTFSNGATIIASEHNSNFDVLYSDYNGNITTANISASANIADTKLAQITSVSKVSGTALTGLASTPSGAGVIPTANLGSGTFTINTVLKGTGAFAVSTFGTVITGQSENTVYQAATDGFVEALFTFAGSDQTTTLSSDSSNPPTTVRDYKVNVSGVLNPARLSCFVKSGNFYKVTRSNASSAFVMAFWPKS